MLNVTLWWDTSWDWFFFMEGFGGHTPPTPSFIITEGGDFIITEDTSDRMITE